MKKYLILTSIVMMLVCQTFFEDAFGGGMENNGIGIKGFSMGCAFTGIADDASAVHHNPSGLVFNEKDIWYLEAYGYVVSSKTTYSGPTNSGSVSRDSSDETFVIPGFFASKTFDKWAFGFGHYVPFAGGGVKFDDFQGLGSPLESSAGFLAFASAAAYKISPSLSFGMGLTMYYGIMESKSLRDVGGGTYANIKTEYDGIAGYGYNMGLMYKPSDIFSIGINLRSEVDGEMDGDVAGIDSEVEINLPYYLTIGVGCKPDSDITVGILFGYMFWDDLDKIEFTTSGEKTEVKTNFRNSWLVGVGAEYKINEQFLARGGLYHTQCATKKVGINPAAPDVDRFQPSIGIAYKISDKTEISLTGFYVHGYKERNNSKKLDQDNIMILSGVRYTF